MARLWDVATGNVVGKPMPHNGMVWNLMFSADGRTIVRLDYPNKKALARAAGCGTGEPRGVLTHPDGVQEWRLVVMARPS